MLRLRPASPRLIARIALLAMLCYSLMPILMAAQRTSLGITQEICSVGGASQTPQISMFAAPDLPAQQAGHGHSYCPFCAGTSHGAAPTTAFRVFIGPALRAKPVPVLVLAKRPVLILSAAAPRGPPSFV